MMNKKDKVLAAFLVSMGLFTSLQAKVYVSSLSDSEKAGLIMTSDGAKSADPTGSVREPVEND